LNGVLTVKLKAAATFVKQFSSANEFSERAEVPAFSPVLSNCVHFLHKLPTIRSVPAGTLLVEQGAVAASVQLIETGLVKLVHVNACGREAIIGLRSAGWYAGYTSAFLKTPNANSVRAITSCRVVRIPAEDFSRCLAQNPEMLEHFLSVLCLEATSQVSLQAVVMSDSAEDRLEHFMRERMPNELQRKTVDPLPLLKQMELAQMLAITPEHLSRLMKKKKNASPRPISATEPRASL
jgi:CRP-like cAMP-binding protein